MSEKPPEPPPYGALIESARKDAGLSMREAARRAGISDAWWRYVVRGYQKVPGDLDGTPGTIARMARVAGVTPERLEAEGQRPDAAGILREILRREEQAAPAPAEDDEAPLRRIMAMEDLSMDERLAMVALARLMRAQRQAETRDQGRDRNSA